jgi:hypothetical protein
MADNDLQQPQTKKDDLLNLVTEALHSVGLHDLDIGSIRLNVKKQGPPPPGKTAVWDLIEHPDGSVSYQWVCK